MTSKNFWHGPNVRLRAVEPEDAPFFYNLNLDSEMARTIDYLWPPKSMAATREWAQRKSTEESKDDSLFLVMDNSEGVTVGSISTHAINRRAGSFSYGVAVALEHRGRGYASEAIVTLVRYYFAELGYQKVTATVYEFNPSSIRLHEKLGFQLEGRVRRLIYTRGRHYDELYYGLLREEFADRHGLTST